MVRRVPSSKRNTREGVSTPQVEGVWTRCASARESGGRDQHTLQPERLSTFWINGFNVHNFGIIGLEVHIMPLSSYYTLERRHDFSPVRRLLFLLNRHPPPSSRWGNPFADPAEYAKDHVDTLYVRSVVPRSAYLEWYNSCDGRHNPTGRCVDLTDSTQRWSGTSIYTRSPTLSASAPPAAVARPARSARPGTDRVRRGGVASVARLRARGCLAPRRSTSGASTTLHWRT